MQAAAQIKSVALPGFELNDLVTQEIERSLKEPSVSSHSLMMSSKPSVSLGLTSHSSGSGSQARGLGSASQRSTSLSSGVSGIPGTSYTSPPQARHSRPPSVSRPSSQTSVTPVSSEYMQEGLGSRVGSTYAAYSTKRTNSPTSSSSSSNKTGGYSSTGYPSSQPSYRASSSSSVVGSSSSGVREYKTQSQRDVGRSSSSHASASAAPLPAHSGSSSSLASALLQQQLPSSRAAHQSHRSSSHTSQGSYGRSSGDGKGHKLRIAKKTHYSLPSKKFMVHFVRYVSFRCFFRAKSASDVK